MFQNKHLTKLCLKCPLHLKYVLALPWEIQSYRSSLHRSTYTYILVDHNESLNSYKHDWPSLSLKSSNV